MSYNLSMRLKRPCRRNAAGRISAVILMLLFPAQALAHCGVLAGDASHHHDLHVPQGPSHGEASVGVGTGDSCVLDAPVFVAQKAGQDADWNVLSPIFSIRDVVPPLLERSSMRVARARACSPAPLLTPLRI